VVELAPDSKGKHATDDACFLEFHGDAMRRIPAAEKHERMTRRRNGQIERPNGPGRSGQDDDEKNSDQDPHGFSVDGLADGGKCNVITAS
jgi:hypothetical protein